MLFYTVAMTMNLDNHMNTTAHTQYVRPRTITHWYHLGWHVVLWLLLLKELDT